MVTTDAIAGISEAGYTATPDQIKELGALSIGATRLKDTIGTTYMRALVKRAQAYMVAPRDAVDIAHNALYPYVLQGVTTDDVKPLLPPAATPAAFKAENKRRSLERNSRSNFARTAASTLRRFVSAGGHLMDLDVENLTKSGIVGSTPKPITTPDDIGPQTTPTHSVWGSLDRAFIRFVASLDKDSDRINTSLHYINRLTKIHERYF